MNPELLQKYQQLAKQYQLNCDSNKRRLKFLSYTRLICFLSLFPTFYYLNQVNVILALTASLLIFTAFLFLIKKFIQTEKQMFFYQYLAEINLHEISALNRNLNAFDPGNEFIDPHHDFSYDLDLFGNGSLFQFLNRTVTSSGKIRLASLLKESQRTPEEILNRQAAIQELAEELTWRQHFMAIGKETEEQKNRNKIDQTISTLIILKSPNSIKRLLLTLPAVTLLLIGLNISGIVVGSYYFIPIFTQWIIFILYSKTISKFHKQFESQSKLLNRYSEMLLKIETKSFSSDYLTQLKHKLASNHKPASKITFELQKILGEFDYRQNILVGFILNSVLLWDLRCISKLNDWQQKYGHELPSWFDVIAETDALTSLANCNYNHPEWAIPIVQPSGFILNTVDLGHPLIDEKRSVRNSFCLTDQEQIAIITGANMAGKSTFLRTVGINLILASNGCKVCAQSFKFGPIRIFTNMRTSDNLMNDESYFYAELLRLQAMLNLLRNGEGLFVIVDEMLKGTNSVDKLNGSKELILQLISLKTHGIVATHDLGLTELSEKYPNSIKNLCFEVQLYHDDLIFDYKLTPGVTQTMNATFLMKKMGIIPNQEKVIGQ
jgi:DNA mismatch repair ATPase MutS